MANDQQYGSSGDLAELLDALASFGSDELRVTEAAALEVILESVGGQQQSAVDVAAAIDALASALGSEGGDHLLVEENSALDVSGATVPVEQQTPVGVEDTSGAQVDPLDASARTSVSDVSTSTGAANAARVDLGDHRAFVSVGWDLSGAATITVEGSNDGGSTWHPIRQFSPSSGEIGGVDLTAGWQEVRVYADADLNEVNIAGKGA